MPIYTTNKWCDQQWTMELMQCGTSHLTLVIDVLWNSCDVRQRPTTYDTCHLRYAFILAVSLTRFAASVLQFLTFDYLFWRRRKLGIDWTDQGGCYPLLGTQFCSFYSNYTICDHCQLKLCSTKGYIPLDKQKCSTRRD